MIDEAFISLSDLIVELADHEGHVEGGEFGFNMEIESVKLGLPIELDIVVDEDGSVELGGVPPLYYIEASIMPVFHSIEVSLEKES